MKRREFIRTLGAASASGLLNPWGALGRALAAVPAQAPPGKKRIVVIFQRGAVDALSMVIPHGDSNYNKGIRPNLFIPTQADTRLDSYFSLNPVLAPLKEFWEAGQMSVIHQFGSPSPSRSHFDAQDFFESGTPGVKTTEDGFLGRFAENPRIAQGYGIGPLAMQAQLPRLLAGHRTALSFNSLKDFQIRGGGGNFSDFESYFDSALDEVLTGKTQGTSALMHQFEKVKSVSLEQPVPKGALGKHLMEIAQIIKAGLDIPIFVTEVGGWDTHVQQGALDGQLANRLRQFSDAIHAFMKELGPRMADVTLITVTEFGRTVQENGNRGTDHGHGSCSLVFGGGLKRKNLIAQWKDLRKANLFEERDLPVTTDFRAVFSEILTHQFRMSLPETVFPGFKPAQKVGLFA